MINDKEELTDKQLEEITGGLMDSDLERFLDKYYDVLTENVKPNKMFIWENNIKEIKSLDEVYTIEDLHFLFCEIAGGTGGIFDNCLKEYYKEYYPNINLY